MLFVVLFVCGGEGDFVRLENPGQVKIKNPGADQEACLEKNAAATGTAATDPATLAHAVAMARAPETELLKG
jgi:hypothetical protein